MGELDEILEKECVLMHLIYERGLHQYFEFAITYDCKDYHLWIRCTLYAGPEDVDNLAISHLHAEKIMNNVFPLSKWDIDRDGMPMLDGPFLIIFLRRMNLIHIETQDFSETAVSEMMHMVTQAYNDAIDAINGYNYKAHLITALTYNHYAIESHLQIIKYINDLPETKRDDETKRIVKLMERMSESEVLDNLLRCL